MEEWITHYLKEGVDKFLLIDNNSDENDSCNYLNILQPYINSGIVELNIEPNKHVQVESYNKFYREKCKEYDWVIVCDLDEFIYSRKEFPTIKSYLDLLDDSISLVFIPWKMFGSNGYNTTDKKQPYSVIQSFTKRTNYDKSPNMNVNTKCIIRSKYLNEIYIHNHYMTNTNYITSDGKTENIDKYYCSCKINEEILETSSLHLNHYAIQSFEWFMRIKATRGDNNSINSENVRNENYFYSYDNECNDIYDNELANKHI
jgi:hypothetical protein